ncbi:MAG: FG-GAP-like repeat-containing protein, partial [Gemmataceae bacterium]
VTQVVDFNQDGKLDLSILDRDSGTVGIFFGNGDGTFSSTATFTSLGSNALQTVGNFNGDAFLDLYVIDDAGNVSLFACLTSSGNFAVSNSTVPLTASLGVMTSGDFDADGNPDIALPTTQGTVTRGNTSILVLLGGGTLDFNEVGLQSSRSPQPTPLLADLNQDGVLDAVVLDEQGNILYRQGRPSEPGAFEAPFLVNPGQLARDVVAVTDGGQVRLAAVDTSRNQISLYTLSTSGTFVSSAGPTLPTTYTRLAAGDLNNDGLSDLVVSGTTGLAVFLFDTAAGSFQQATSLPGGNSPASVSIGQFDGTGGVDILAANELSGDISLFSGAGNGSSFVAHRYRSGSTPFGMDPDNGFLYTVQQTIDYTVADFDLDGNLDLVAIQKGSNSFSFLAQVNADVLAAPRSFQAHGRTFDIASGDFNLDKAPDVAILDDTGIITIYLGDGAGNFYYNVAVNAGNLPEGLDSADLNGDGFLDLAVTNDSGDLLVILGNGDGTFRPFVRTARNVPFVTTDINGDGVADVLLANQSVDQVLSQIRNAGTTTFTLGNFSQTSANGIQGPGFVELDDVNNDNIQDLLVANTGSNNIIIYLGVGPGQFNSNGLTFSTGTAPVSSVVFDSDGDGSADVAVANQGSNDVSILLGGVDLSGNWTLTPGPRLSVGTGPNNISVDDYTGDGINDLMVTNGTSADLWLLSGVGNGFFNDATPSILPMPGPISQTLFTVTTGFTLLQSGSIVNFNPFNFAVAPVTVFISPPSALVTSLTFAPNSTNFFAGRSNSTISLLTASSSGQYADSLIFSDASLTFPSALSVVGTDLYVTNEGSSIPLVFSLNATGSGLFGLGSGFGNLSTTVTTLSSIDQAQLSVIATVLASNESTDGEDEASDEEGEEEGFVAGLNVGLIGSTSLLGLLLAQTVSEESGNEEDPAEEDEPELDTPVWVEFVVGLQDAIDEFRVELLTDQDDVATAMLDRWLAGVSRWLTAATTEVGSSARIVPPTQDKAADTVRSTATDPVLQKESTPAFGQAPDQDGEALVSGSDALLTLPALWRDWWPALAAATLTSFAWLGWRRQRDPARRTPEIQTAPPTLDGGPGPLDGQAL